MSFTPRAYPEIVRDLLTTLTGGTVRETLTVSPDGPITLEKLHDRPVRRISHLEGVASVGTGDNEREVAYRFTGADFELVRGDREGEDMIRFREAGRKPVPGSTLTVNYYPVHTDPVPLTDLNVGSVCRTLLETFAREMAVAYLHLESVYDSAFLGTATGSSLDRVVALVGVRRLAAGHPVARVRFQRKPGTPGQITIPGSTAVTGPAGQRYRTVAALTLEPYESTREIQVAGESPDTEVVEAGQLDRLELVVAGISEVTNPAPARRLSAPESDDALRQRAASALAGEVRGTVDALRFGLESVPGVTQVAVVEQPNGVPGEVRVEVAFADDGSEAREAVSRRIEELRPAGVRVLFGEAARRQVAVRGDLLLAGASLPEAELNQLLDSLADRLGGHLSALPPGATVRRAQLLSLALQDERVVDASIYLVREGVESEEMELGDGEVLEVTTVAFDPVDFEDASDGPVQPAVVGAVLPLLLEPGVPLAEATEAVRLALEAHLADRGPGSPLTVDALAAAVRDDSRYALVRDEALVTIESGERFLQLTDGVGSYAPVAGEAMVLGDLQVTDAGGRG